MGCTEAVSVRGVEVELSAIGTLTCEACGKTSTPFAETNNGFLISDKNCRVTIDSDGFKVVCRCGATLLSISGEQGAEGKDK